MKNLRLTGFFLSALSALALAGCDGPTSPDGVETEIVRVVDGDTVVTELGTVRMIGVNTPETVHPRQPVQCYGPEASAYTKDVLEPGTVVYLEPGLEDKDRFGRLLRYVRLQSGQDFNLRLLETGHARAEQRFEHPRMDDYVEAEAHAMERSVGLWGACPR